METVVTTTVVCSFSKYSNFVDVVDVIRNEAGNRPSETHVVIAARHLAFMQGWATFSLRDFTKTEKRKAKKKRTDMQAFETQTHTGSMAPLCPL